MVSEQLLEALDQLLDKGTTRYRIAKDSGVNHTVLCQLLRRERSVRMDTLDMLADYLGLELRPKTTRRK
ncbi:MAG TPA: helix-turn-helix domain-containing protein [Thermoguttaceae bacterium]|nr:helix-turn-helix domain-containing protein [Thermoguttaceae bacterium]